MSAFRACRLSVAGACRTVRTVVIRRAPVHNVTAAGDCLLRMTAPMGRCLYSSLASTVNAAQLHGNEMSVCIHSSRTLQGGLWERKRYTTEAAPLTLADIKRRVVDVCKAFDKINADKLTEDSHFMNDLGLDSLDQVELVMAMEDEFGFEIPDAEAEKLFRPADIIKYVASKESVSL